MATAATSLLGLALPVTGELSGTWGDTVNVSITALLDTAVAGTTTLSADSDVTLTTTTLAANQARQAIILWTAGGTVTRTITVPAQSKSYIVINKTSSSQSIKIIGVGPTTGVTIVAGTAAFVVWNGVDFVTASVTSTTGVLPVANGGTGLSSGTSGGVLAYTATGTLASSTALAASALVIGGGAGAAPSTTTTGTGVVTALGVNTGTAGAFVVNGGALGTPSSGTATNLTGLPLTTGVTGTLPTANGGTNLTSFTSGGVVYASSSSALATGSALTFDGTNLGLGVTPSAWGSGQRALQTPAGAIWNFNNVNMTIVQNVFHDGTEKYVNNGFASAYNQNTGRHVWSVAPSGTAGDAISFTQAMTLDASGNLLVGTTTTNNMSGTKVQTLGSSGIVDASSASVAQNGTLTLTANSGGGSFTGFLSVSNVFVANAASRTQALYAIMGRGTNFTATQLATADGTTSGASFTVTCVSNGVITVTNTYAGNTQINMTYTGHNGG